MHKEIAVVKITICKMMYERLKNSVNFMSIGFLRKNSDSSVEKACGKTCGECGKLAVINRYSMLVHRAVENGKRFGSGGRIWKNSTVFRGRESCLGFLFVPQNRSEKLLLWEKYLTNNMSPQNAPSKFCENHPKSEALSELHP